MNLMTTRSSDLSFAQRELKWKPRKDFKAALNATIEWYLGPLRARRAAG
jgi:nucleoside-diphosphate-sugar epimerase